MFNKLGSFLNKEKNYFKKVEAENKIESYSEFLRRYPKGEFSNQAQDLLEKRYRKGIEVCADFIIADAALCIEQCSLYSVVWRNAIESRYRDFNIELTKLHEKLEESYNESENLKLKIEEFMKKFTEPPPKYVEVHKKIVELYGTYSQIYSLAHFPSGSLMSYNNSVNQLQSNLIKIKSELDVMIGKR